MKDIKPLVPGEILNKDSALAYSLSYLAKLNKISHVCAIAGYSCGALTILSSFFRGIFLSGCYSILFKIVEIVAIIAMLIFFVLASTYAMKSKNQYTELYIKELL